MGLGLGASLAAACTKRRVVGTWPPPPQANATCLVGGGFGPGEPAAPPPFQQCAATHQQTGCGGPFEPRFNETETRMARQRDATLCCYDKVALADCQEPQMRGRAFRSAMTAAPRSAPIKPRGDWLAAEIGQELPDATTCQRLASAWAQDAQMEHASVAAFSQLSLALLQLGAPPDLIRAAHEAALDEIAHAQTCFAIASTYAQRALGPGPLDTTGTCAQTTLVELAVSTLVDGCFGETTAALEAREAARGAHSPGLRKALDQIAEDEVRHAELGWRIIAWTVRTDRSVLKPLERAAQQLERAAFGPAQRKPDNFADDEACLEPHGRLSASARAAIARQCLDDIVRPCVAVLGRG